MVRSSSTTGEALEEPDTDSPHQYKLRLPTCLNPEYRIVFGQVGECSVEGESMTVKLTWECCYEAKRLTMQLYVDVQHHKVIVTIEVSTGNVKSNN